MALALKCLPILLMVTLISANLLTTTSGLEISHTSVSSLTNCDGVGTCEYLVLVLKFNY